jgi:hypothetical protein
MNTIISPTFGEPFYLRNRGRWRIPAILGKAVLLAWTDVPVVNEVEFNEWYSFEHIRERIGIPGFKRCAPVYGRWNWTLARQMVHDV